MAVIDRNKSIKTETNPAGFPASKKLEEKDKTKHCSSLRKKTESEVFRNCFQSQKLLLFMSVAISHISCSQNMKTTKEVKQLFSNVKCKQDQNIFEKGVSIFHEAPQWSVKTFLRFIKNSFAVSIHSS